MTNFPNVDENFKEMAKTLSDFFEIEMICNHMGETTLVRDVYYACCNNSYPNPFSVALTKKAHNSRISVEHWFSTKKSDDDRD